MPFTINGVDLMSGSPTPRMAPPAMVTRNIQANDNPWTLEA